MTEGFNENVKYSTMRREAMRAALYWSREIRVRYDTVFYFEGVRVHMLIEEHKTKDDTKPIFDEDERIAD
jgi:hypothetical protein